MRRTGTLLTLTLLILLSSGCAAHNRFCMAVIEHYEKTEVARDANVYHDHYMETCKK